MCLVTVRQIKPGSYDDFRAAWEPDPWPAQLQRVEILRNDDDPDQVMTVGYVDVTPDELEAMRDEADDPRGRGRSGWSGSRPFEDRVLVNSIFELVEEVKP